MKETFLASSFAAIIVHRKPERDLKEPKMEY